MLISVILMKDYILMIKRLLQIFLVCWFFWRELNMPKIQESKGRWSITLPVEFVLQAQLQKGDVVTVSFNERGNLELKKLKR